MTPQQEDVFIQKVLKAIKDEQAEDHKAQHDWIKLAMQAEAQKIAFRRAVIEKTLGSLILAGALGLVTLLWMFVKEYAINHGMWKP